MLLAVVDDYSLETVQEYMYHIRNNAENSVRSLLRDVVKKSGTNFLTAVDYLDDGTPVSSDYRTHKIMALRVMTLLKDPAEGRD